MQKLDVINLRQKIPQLDEITTVKWFLAANNSQIIVIGYSKQSVSNMQYIYQLFDYQENITKIKGRINNFGVLFLSEYVAYQEDGEFLMLCQSHGTRKVILQNFFVGVTSTLIKQIEKHSFQEQALKQWSCIHYSQNHNKLYLLQISQFSTQQTNLFFRVFLEDIEVASYRLICLQYSFPKIVFSPQHILCLSQDQFVVYKENFQQLYFNYQNMQQFKILGFFYEMILQFKQDKSIFIMSINGKLKPILQEFVVSFLINQFYIAFLYLKESQYRIATFQYKDKTLKKRSDIDTGITKSTAGKKSVGFRIISSNKNQILIGDNEIT